MTPEEAAIEAKQDAEIQEAQQRFQREEDKKVNDHEFDLFRQYALIVLKSSSILRLEEAQAQEKAALAEELRQVQASFEEAKKVYGTRKAGIKRKLSESAAKLKEDIRQERKRPSPQQAAEPAALDAEQHDNLDDWDDMYD